MEKIMWSRKEAIIDIFNRHGKNALYITSTGYISRDIHNLFPNNKNILYMQGSMGLSPSIALGIALNSNQNIVSINGDAALLMHLGITHSIRDHNLNNLFVYVLDNGCHESVGGDKCSPLLDEYISVDKIYKINKEGKKTRIKISPVDNKKEFTKILRKTQS
jgi:phosphonopyruvate decarboxylase